MKIGIVGQGYVGTAIKVGFEPHYKLETYDKYDEDKRKGRKVTHSNINETLKIGKETFIEATETLDECYNRFKDDNYDKIPVSHISDNLVVR